MQKNTVIQCELCPKLCRIAEGFSGDCRCRMVVDGELRAVTYGKPCAVHIDPIEKKPLFHFLPGSPILSIASAGCNLHCKFCQNWTISQEFPHHLRRMDLPPDKVVDAAGAQGCASIAYTYTDPVVFFEYCLDTSTKAREHGLKNVAVTAGYINRKPLKMLCEVLDASNTDLKSFNDSFYRTYCDGKLKPVLDGLVTMKEHGVWVEITNLVIPTLNDDPAMIGKMCRWIVANLGAETPLHLSRFRPMYKIRNVPPTPVEFLVKAREIALDVGLHHVYVGNVLGTDAENTYCPNDGTLLVERHGYLVRSNNLDSGKCPTCGTPVAGVWSGAG